MYGLQGTLQAHGFPQLLEAHIGFRFQQAIHLLPMLNQNQWLASGQVMPLSDVPAVTPLLEQLLDNPQGYPEAMSCLVTATSLLRHKPPESVPSNPRRSFVDCAWTTYEPIALIGYTIY
jgi:hypothetical protein